MTKNRRQPRSLRVIGGQWRGRRLSFPAGTDVRPTTDRIRETVFNWLEAHVAGAQCLDLFAGSGMFGIEALSRGARFVQFVERDRRLAQSLELTLGTLGGSGDVRLGNALDYLREESSRVFDLVFLDPPYAEPIEPVLAALEPRAAPAAQIYVERARGDALPSLPNLNWRKVGRAGAVVFGLAAFG